MFNSFARPFAILAVLATLWAPIAQARSVTGTVVRVVDGDTVDVLVAGKVERIRIIGLDTPETVDPRKPVQCFGREASARAKELMPAGSEVILEPDPTQDTRDRYGRMLAHIFVHLDAETEVSFALAMIAEGLAHHYVYRVPSIYAASYESAQADAQANARGLWSPETCAGQAYPKHDLEDPVPGSPAAPVATVAGEAASQAAVVPTPTSALPVGFDPAFYLGKGNAFNCTDFKSQSQAQAVLRADPGDPNGLDTDGDGIACESNPSPKDLVPVQRPATPPTGTSTPASSPAPTGTPRSTATAAPTSTSISIATPTPTVMHTVTSALLPTATATPVATLTPTIPATLRTRLLRVTSVSDQAFTVTWVTDVASSGGVRWWPEGNLALASTLADSRGASSVHVVTVGGLLPSTRYAFDLLADFTTDGNGGAHYVVATGPTLGVTPPDTVAGTVVRATSGAPGRAVAVLTVDAGDGSSASIAGVADASGRWQLDLGALRASSRLAVLPYTTTTVLSLEVIAGTDGYARRTLTVAEARAGTVATTLATSVTQSLSLDAGWTLVALPLAPSSDLTAKGICDGARTTGTNTAGSVREVARWQDGGWQSYLCTPGTGDFALEPSRGYFVRTVAPATLVVTGVPFDGRLLLEMRAGWNLVGLPGTGPRLSATGIVAAVEAASVPPGSDASPAVTELDWWETGQWVGYLRGVPVNTTKVLPDGRGAFLRLTRPSTWLLPGIVGTNRVEVETGPDR